MYCPGSSTTSTITVSQSQLSGVSTTSDGGVFYIAGTGAKSVLIQLSSTITSVASGGSGGILYVSATSSHLIELNSVTVESLTASGDGAVYYPASATSITLRVIGSTFKSFQSSLLGSFTSIKTLTGSNTLSVTLTGSTFTCKASSIWGSWPAVYNSVVTQLGAATPSTIGGLFYVQSAASGSTITSSNNVFQQCYTTTTGSVFYLPTGVVLNDDSSTFK